jgi:DNA mismatch endonuclease (patch repair protein)
MRANKASETRPERALRSALHRRGLRFRKHCRPVRSVPCRADVVFASAKVAVFVDGCFWHSCPEHGVMPKTNSAYWRAKLELNRWRDDRNDRALAAEGWRVVRAWEHESPVVVAERVAALVRLRQRAPRSPPTQLPRGRRVGSSDRA